jgi:non-canonical purine NTP pyrophosphatase (RdgB/HAM1 family)
MFNVLIIGPSHIDWASVKQSLPATAEAVAVKQVASLSALKHRRKLSGVDMILYDQSLGMEGLKNVSRQASPIPIVYYSDSVEDAMAAMSHEVDDFVVPSAFALPEQLINIVLRKWMRRKALAERDDTIRNERIAHDFQAIFASITNSLIKSMSLDEINPDDVREILRQVGQLLDVDSTAVYFFHNGNVDRDNYFLWRRNEEAPKKGRTETLQMESAHFKDLWIFDQLSQGKAIIFSTPQEIPAQAEYEHKEIARYGIQSGMEFPLMVNGQFTGIFRVTLTREQRNWQETEIGIARVCAEIFTTVLLRWRSIAQLQRSVRALRHRNMEITAINQMGIRLQRSRNLSQIFSVAEHFTNDLFPNSVGMLHLCNKNDQPATITQWGEWPFELLVEVEQIFSTLEEQLSTVEKNCAIDMMCERLHEEILNINTEVKPICVPLKVRNDNIGMLSLFFVRNHDISNEVRVLVMNFAERIGLAVANLQLQEALHFHSIRDPLTGLYNRRFMEHVFENEMHRTVRREHPLSVMMMDVDHFKTVNDALGHEIGDQVLKSIAQFLVSHLRREDIICRYGGDEFVIILPETRAEDAFTRANDLRLAITDVQSDPLIKHFNISGLSLSIGIACYPTHGDEPSDLLRAADHALYYSKNHGRNTVRIAPKEITGQLKSQTRRNLSIKDWVKTKTGGLPEDTTASNIGRIPLVIATNNLGKMREIQEILSQSGMEDTIELFRPHDLGIDLEVEETGSSYAENAALKVKAFYEAVNGQFPKFIVLADDSGLEVDALDGKPGIRSSRYAPIPNATDKDRRRFLLKELKNQAQPWTAAFQCTVALLSTESTEVEYFSGTCPGEIIAEERGTGGFGYDPVFWLPEKEQTMAELSGDEKNAFSHRGNALRHAVPRLKALAKSFQGS